MIWHIRKYSRSQLGHILKHGSGPKDQNGSIWGYFGNEKSDTNQRTHFGYNLHERKDGLSDYDFVKSSNGIPLLNVRKREDINWVGSWVITLPESLPARPPEG